MPESSSTSSAGREERAAGAPSTSSAGCEERAAGVSRRTDWRDTLRERGYRLTPQREMILRAVDDLGHATPDEVLARVQEHASTVNASTVYRTLEVLEELGLVRHAHLSDRAPTYHSTRGHTHFHLVCRDCRTVISVAAEEANGFVATLSSQHGFTPDLGHLTVFGRCRDCEETQ